jgi:hypothetical protein
MGQGASIGVMRVRSIPVAGEIRAWHPVWMIHLLVVPLLFIALILSIGGVVGLGIARMFRVRREHVKLTVGIFAVAGIVGFYAWAIEFNSPLPLPASASDVQIRRAAPFQWEINDNLRFKVKEPEFQRWIESLVGKPWSEMLAGGSDAKIERNSGFQRPLSAPDWMESNATTKGYTITAHPKVYGTIWYDSDREIVHYHFDD